ncbi:hypothetical protein Vadar_006939 [Vaccinium darrowii]|uniref:Uncharacterized protein n=1 Tax=Vaccinium darrowii TaxID=229202 RepID=A0ACB7XGD6_9ERIC|nr:hypothetical protein Vadar_006939 [Vaccinium darrowii]
MILVAIVAEMLEEYTMLLGRVLEHMFHEVPLPFPRRRLSLWRSWFCCDRFSVELDVGPLHCQGVSQVFIEVEFYNSVS